MLSHYEKRLSTSPFESFCCMWRVIYRDQIVFHLWHHANHLTNTTERLLVDTGKPLETFHSTQLYSLEIELVLGDHAFVSS
ncbi:hypothetical protein IFVP5_C1210010 [Vibrio parahaemolyticus]